MKGMNIKMKRIFLMRHSIPEKRDMPNEQIPLSEEGKALALSKSNVLSNVDRCFSSPYRRAVETAELIVDHHSLWRNCMKGRSEMPRRISG